LPPIFFGPSVQPLYGFLEAPRTRPRKTGVLLLYPGVQEYMRAHWAFRSLANGLAERGFPVLRFDYRGVGDSAGEPERTTFESCVDDACIAAEELREAMAVERVALIGMRLGAAIAARAAMKLPFVQRVLLWTPVVSGQGYLAELEYMDQAMRLRLLHAAPRPSDELAGYRFPPDVRRSIERIDLRDFPPGHARRFDILAQFEAQETRELCEALRGGGHTVLNVAISDSGEPANFPDAALLAQGAITTLVARMDESER
jgi:pimeloyl-ACP methyl ester carboxylesterase